MAPNKENFQDFIDFIFKQNIKLQNEWVDIKSGNIHQLLGSYPGRSNRMKSCCTVMYKLTEKMKHEIISAPPKGFGANLVIRFYLSLPSESP